MALNMLEADVALQESFRINRNVRKRIYNDAIQSSEDYYGVLIGDVAECEFNIVGCIRCTNYENATEKRSTVSCKPLWVKEVAEICTLIPTGLKVGGLCFVSKNKPDAESSILAKEIFSGVDVENEFINRKQILWLFDLILKDNDEETMLVLDLCTESVKESKVFFDDINDDFISKHVTFRLRHKFEVIIEESSTVDISMCLSQKTTRFCNKLHNATFYVPECGLFIGQVKNNTVKTCQEILDNVIINEEFGQEKQKINRRSKSKQKEDVLNVILVQRLSKNESLNNHNHVPMVLCEKEESSYLKFVMALDVLVTVAINSSISKLPSLFQRGIKDQLQGILSCFDTYSIHKDSLFCIPKIFHFQTPQTPYLSTCIYPWKLINNDVFNEKEFENERSRLLKKLFLPAQRPTLHPDNVYLFQSDRSNVSPYIVNPHERLTNPGGEGCHVAVVDGRYTYHHYMQDNFDDNKWGCAYRSLQTIFSWFRYQGYTDKTIPGHRSIQEALVALGDKQTSFVGSKKWIGSFEVHLCLDYFLDVSSKIMAVNTGAELQNKGRELIRHFETQGTPVMIGGGVLAHTILGVSFNDKTGEIKFLILDPHYTGGEDIKIILDKGWCGWKNHLFWNQQAHYNLCMPQRPVKV